jgi:hypothetical protein
MQVGPSNVECAGLGALGGATTKAFYGTGGTVNEVVKGAGSMIGGKSTGVGIGAGKIIGGPGTEAVEDAALSGSGIIW